ncbi:hypothetical protein ACFU3E_33460 [Streptomyces sp. NPDC057424]|uniref:hypothetical protein n=1 Tax=Streptomyces sp. NPDC057424 TaxID=3346127 RepID=UPI00368D6E77
MGDPCASGDLAVPAVVAATQALVEVIGRVRCVRLTSRLVPERDRVRVMAG